jgi:hypothetical protein
MQVYVYAYRPSNCMRNFMKLVGCVEVNKGHCKTGRECRTDWGTLHNWQDVLN